MAKTEYTSLRVHIRTMNATFVCPWTDFPKTYYYLHSKINFPYSFNKEDLFRIFPVRRHLPQIAWITLFLHCSSMGWTLFQLMLVSWNCLWIAAQSPLAFKPIALSYIPNDNNPAGVIRCFHSTVHSSTLTEMSRNTGHTRLPRTSSNLPTKLIGIP